MVNIYNRFKNFFLSKAMVLMYHRIADVQYDPWQLCVTPSNFEQQLQFFTKHFNVVSVSELIDQLSSKKIKKNTVCITFDDGYTDNFLEAKPLLEKYNCPATFFIASNYIGSDALFWWDQLEDIILSSPTLPSEIRFVIKDKEYAFYVANTTLSASDIARQMQWQWPDAPPNERCKLYLEIWEILLPNDYSDIRSVVQQLCVLTNYEITPPEGKIPMNPQQLKLLAGGGLFELGIHTHTHPALSFHSKEYQLNEMTTCRNFLKPCYQAQVNTIAYPYGRFNETTLHALREAGIKAGFTTNGKLITNKTDISRIGRFQVNNWNEYQLSNQLKYWTKMF